MLSYERRASMLQQAVRRAAKITCKNGHSWPWGKEAIVCLECTEPGVVPNVKDVIAGDIYIRQTLRHAERDIPAANAYIKRLFESNQVTSMQRDFLSGLVGIMREERKLRGR